MDLANSCQPLTRVFSCEAAGSWTARIGDPPICGSCKERLFTGRPVTLTEASFDRFIGRMPERWQKMARNLGHGPIGSQNWDEWNNHTVEQWSRPSAASSDAVTHRAGGKGVGGSRSRREAGRR